MLKYLKSPFEYIAGVRSLVIGTIIISFTGVMAYSTNVHQNGLLNVKFIGFDTAPYIFFLEGFINALVVSFVLYLLGIIFSKSKIRFIDLLGTQSVSRIGILLLVILTKIIPINYEALSKMKDANRISMPSGDEMTNLILLAILSIPIIIYTVVLMYKSFSISCNIKGGRGITLFIIGFIISEICLQVLYHYVVFKNNML